VFASGGSGIEVIIVKSTNKRYYIRSNAKFRGFIIHPDNYQKDHKKIEIELIQILNGQTPSIEYREIDKVIMFDSENLEGDKMVYIILSNPPGTTEEKGKKLYFSEVRMDDSFEKESEVVWWIYLVIGLIAFLFLVILVMMTVLCLSKVENDQVPTLSEIKETSKISSSLSKSDSEHFKTNETNSLPGPLNTEYLKGNSVSRT
jgi:Na+-transporting methylmalonyl-CoA/oxaloacetate decarboxylase gamma subunit